MPTGWTAAVLLSLQAHLHGPGASEVAVETTRALSAELVPASIIAERTAGHAHSGPLRVAVEAPGGRAVLRLAPGLWTLTPKRPGFAAWPVQVYVPVGSGDSIRLPLWPEGRIGGALRPTGDEGTPPRVSVRRLRDREAGHGPPQVLEPPIACVAQDGRFVCALPGGRWDLQLDLEPLIPRYLWDVVVPNAGQVDVGDVLLARGSSVAGWIGGTGRARSASPAVVELRTAAGQSIAAGAASGGPAFTTSAGTRGFFQIGPIPPVSYELVARDGSRVSRPERVNLRPDREERLRERVVLRAPARLQVEVDPPLDPSAQPWRARLLAVEANRGRLVVRGEAMSAAGVWSRSNLPAGSYRLAVVAASGDVWDEREIDIGLDSEPLRVALRLLHIAGTVRIGDEPMAGRITLGPAAVNSAVSVTFDADETGRFTGVMPRPKDAEETWRARVRSSDPLVLRDIARVAVDWVGESDARIDIRLPDAAIEGVVRDESGRPFNRTAFVFAQSIEDDSELGLVQARLLPGDEGRFRVRGLEAGEYRLYADAGSEYKSEELQVALTEKKATAATLVLRRARSAAGRVVATEGTPVPGAEVMAVPAQSPFGALRPVHSDAEGRFEVSVPDGTRELLLSVGAAGFARRLMRRPLSSGGELLIALEEAGGTLHLAGDLDDVYVVHDGGSEAARSLARWGALHGGSGGSDGVRVPQMAAGLYQLCRAHSREVLALVAGMLPEANCVGGYLQPGSELLLRAPTASP